MIDLDSASVADLLEASRLAHQRYRENIPHMVTGPGGRAVRAEGDEQAANDALFEAARTRAEAHAKTDMVHVARPGEPETHDHDALLDFYADLLSR